MGIDYKPQHELNPMTRAAFSAMAPVDQMEFRRLGGVVTDDVPEGPKTVTLAEYNADPGRYALEIGRGEMRVVD